MGVRDTEITIPDTNACLAYSIDHTVDVDGKPTPICREKTKEIQAYLEPKISQGSVWIINTVHAEMVETTKAALRDIVHDLNLGPILIRQLELMTREKFAHMSQGTIHPDSPRLLGKVANTYGRIWDDPEKEAKRKMRAKVKGVSASGGPVEGPDLLILATAADAAESRDVEILTLDHDFIPFAGEILEDLGVRIRNGWEL